MKQNDEDINYPLVIMIYTSIILILVALSYVLKEMRVEMTGGGTKNKVKKAKKNN